MRALRTHKAGHGSVYQLALRMDDYMLHSELVITAVAANKRFILYGIVQWIY